MDNIERCPTCQQAIDDPVARDLADVAIDRTIDIDGAMVIESERLKAQLAGAVEERDRLRVENARLRGEYADELRESVRFWRFAAYAGWMLWIVAMVAAVVV